MACSLRCGGLLSLRLLLSATGGVAELVFPLDTPGDATGGAEELTERGTAALHEGRSLLAASTFTLASARHSQEGSVFNNLATALAVLGSERGGDEGALCEALAAGQLAMALGYADASELVAAIQSQLPSGTCEGAAAQHDAVAALLDGTPTLSEHLRMASAMCSDRSAMAVRPTARESEAGIWAAGRLLRIWLLMRVCGVVSLEEVIPKALVSRVREEQARHFQVASAGMPSSGTFQESDAASRGGLRQEVKLPLVSPFTDPELSAGPLLRSVVRLLVGERAELDTFSYIESAPGSLDQAWHNDAPTPKERAGCHTPPVGLVAVIPLTHMDEQNGATEFLSGSHVEAGDQRFWMAEDGDGGVSDATPKVQLAASAGSVVLFDLRLRHRGRANMGSGHRAVLYFSYVQEWFRDGVNFKDRQTRAWDSMPSVAQRLFARLDGREYVKALEEALAANGIAVADLTSTSNSQRGKLEL